MSFDKWMGKERRRPYYRRGKHDPSCRPGGSCPYCRGSRAHSTRRRVASAESTREGFSTDDPPANGTVRR